MIQQSFIKRLFFKLGLIGHQAPSEDSGSAEKGPSISTQDLNATSAKKTTPDKERKTPLSDVVEAKFSIGQVVRHKMFPFRGVVFDVDPIFSNTDEWYEAIPEEVRPSKDQPYYHLLAENDKTHYVAYVSEQNLRMDDSNTPVHHPEIDDIFGRTDSGAYEIHPTLKN